MRELQLRARYRGIVGAQTVRRQGVVVPLQQVELELESPERRVRERAWRAAAARRQDDAAQLGELWSALVATRVEPARPEGESSDTAWRRRHDALSPDAQSDGRQAQLAVEEFVTSVLVRLHERRRRQLGLRTIRPWDLATVPSIPDATGARIRELDRVLMSWAIGAMIDTLEDWAYADPEQGQDLGAVGATWSSLWLRFLPAVDWSGLEEFLAGEWQRHEALFLRPGESMLGVARELEMMRRWSHTNEPCVPLNELDSLEPEPDGPQVPTTLDDMALLETARWIEDRIEELERGEI